MKSIKKLFKNSAFTFVLGAVVFGIVGVSAASLIYSKDVTYDNSTSGLSSTTVQGALDELYQSAKNGGAKVSCNDSGECTVTCKTGKPTITDGGYACTNTTAVTCPDGKNFIATDSGYKCADMPINETVVTSGDGLYADSTEKGRYIYRGSNPNNYITFNNETWRIISIESDGTLKIVRSQQLSGTYQWDSTSNRSSSTSTYCTYASSWGCNAWAATSNLVGSPSNFTQYYPNGNTSDSTNYTGTVTQDSTMATYLNGTYYNSLSTASKAKVVKGTFNVSTPGNTSDTESLETDAKQEKQYQWKGYVALYTVTELLRASTNSSCTSLSAGYNSESSNGPCSQNNWLWQGFNSNNWEWTLSPYVHSYRRYVWPVYSSGYVDYDNAYISGGVRPVLNLTSNISLGGKGTSSNPYTISG